MCFLRCGDVVMNLPHVFAITLLTGRIKGTAFFLMPARRVLAVVLTIVAYFPGAVRTFANNRLFAAYFTLFPILR